MEDQRVLANKDAEQSVLGSIFYDEAQIKVLADKLKKSDFFYLRHQNIFEAMVELFKMNMPIDSTTVISYLEDKGTLLDCGGSEYILGLMDAVPSVSNVDSYIAIVKDKSSQRKLVQTCNDIIKQTNEDISDHTAFLDDVEKKIFNITHDRESKEMVSISTVLTDVYQKIQRNATMDDDVIGYSTGFKQLNKMTLGFQGTQLLILAARPAMGKTAFALNLAYNVANNKDKPYVAFFSLEMGLDQLVLRLISQIANINQTELKTGKFQDDEAWNRINYAVNKLQNVNIMFDDSGVTTIQDLRSLCRKKKSEGKLDFVVIDYLQLLTTKSKNDSRTQDVSEISRMLKEMAKELDIPVLALAQLSRTVEQRPDKKPIMSDLRESGSIEQDADLVLSIYRDEYYNKSSERKGLADILILKNRSGMTGEFELVFKGECTNFIDTDNTGRGE